MPSLKEAQEYNAASCSQFSAVPVALFIGGTSGIGRGTAEAFARHTKGNAHIIICGTNRVGTYGNYFLSYRPGLALTPLRSRSSRGAHNRVLPEANRCKREA
jgi:hypothetical protein